MMTRTRLHYAAAVFGLLLLVAYGFLSDPPAPPAAGPDIPAEGPITVAGEITCLPKIGPGPHTLECAIGLRDALGRHYVLKNLDQQDPTFEFAATGVRVEVSGNFSSDEAVGPGGSKYDVIGTIDVVSIEKMAASPFLPPIASAAGPVSVSVLPARVVQGEPFRITVDGARLGEVKKVVFNGASLGTFSYQGKLTALGGADLKLKPGAYLIAVSLADGSVASGEVTVEERKRATAPLGIPEKLGGNTTSSQSTLVTTLAAENGILAGLWSQKKALWTGPFRSPVRDPVVTDTYGYSRETGAYEISHKGTDYRAPQGTRVTAVNRGVVRLARTFRNYGKTVVIDHGLGLMSMYMHLSKISVNAGELVTPGKLIGLSGSTGYASGPHLHLSIRVDGTSIDPEKFFALFE